MKEQCFSRAKGLRISPGVRGGDAGGYRRDDNFEGTQRRRKRARLNTYVHSELRLL
jgi:hypothetical protein